MDQEIPDISVVFAATVLVVVLVSLLVGSRGGRYRAVRGWGIYWIFIAAFLVVIERAPLWISLLLLGIVMFGSIREYSFLAPLRRQDRWATLLVYLSIPAILYAVFIDSYVGFLAAILLYLFLFLPGILSLGTTQQGLLDSLGRVLLGVLIFVFCGAHLGFLVHEPTGSLEWFGILVIATDLPQREAGRLRTENGVLRSIAGAVLGFAFAAGFGAWLAPAFGYSVVRGAVGGAVVAFAVTIGGIVTRGVARDLSMPPVGRAAFLDRVTPMVYAAPLFYHFLDYYASG
ncbi:MAG: hypothetical protein R3344_10180 [Acidobacteriota bacterium]|nr:hypothetical protein [Acidobacteriota bacterium]